MTWKEFVDRAKAAGFDDNDEIDYIDFTLAHGPERVEFVRQPDTRFGRNEGGTGFVVAVWD